ncbi:MAG TPA: peptidase E [Candidatus Limnocylindrales bacterium]|nr:peptidase E [Candidatus Limnocylindrales bacterium]
MQIIALGGGGFLMEPENLALDRYALEQTHKERPRVCYLPQAASEHQDMILAFYRAFTALDTRPSWLSLFKPHTADIEGFLLEHDLIYVGGGNTKSMMALWREWGLDRILRKAAEGGTVLAGISAGAICWFECGTTDSVPGALTTVRGLGYLAGSFSPHYDGEGERRPAMQRMVAAGDIPDGYAMDDGAAAHFVDGALVRVVTSRLNAGGYRVVRDSDRAVETPLDVTYLRTDQA